MANERILYQIRRLTHDARAEAIAKLDVMNPSPTDLLIIAYEETLRYAEDEVADARHDLETLISPIKLRFERNELRKEIAELRAENEQLRGRILKLDPPPVYETKEDRIARTDTCDHGVLLLCTCYECNSEDDPDR